MTRIFTPTNLLEQAHINNGIIEAPKIIGNYLIFSGNEGILLPENPLPDWPALAIEVDFYPSSGGGKEQRFLHLGEINGPRFLFETRSHKGQWCLDVFVCGGDGNSLKLIDLLKLYPENRNYRVRAELRPDSVTSFIDGTIICSAKFGFVPFSEGAASIGVRQNQISFFTGRIGEIKIEKLYT